MDRKDHLIWKDLSRELLLESFVFDVYSIRRVSTNGLEGEFIVLNTHDWVNVVPVTKDPRGRPCFVMVHQYRQASRSLTIEFPGGVLEQGEDPPAGARRELLEETGYSAGRLSLAGKIMPNPAIMNNWCYTYVAEDLHKTDGQNLDELELVDYELVPIEEVENKMGTGPYSHAIMMVALDFYNRWRK